jgi:hypothetical protein
MKREIIIEKKKALASLYRRSHQRSPAGCELLHTASSSSTQGDLCVANRMTVVLVTADIIVDLESVMQISPGLPLFGTLTQLLKIYHAAWCHIPEERKKKGKAIPVTGRGGPQGCETSRLPHFLDNRIKDGGKVVSLTRRPSFIPQKDFWYSFVLEAEWTPGL